MINFVQYLHSHFINVYIPLYNVIVTGACQLTCISEETRDILVTETEVTDGTFCSYELPNHICIKGKCKVSNPLLSKLKVSYEIICFIFEVALSC